MFGHELRSYCVHKNVQFYKYKFAFNRFYYFLHVFYHDLLHCLLSEIFILNFLDYICSNDKYWIAS